MADVMGHGHDGDGNEEQPPPFGHHQLDAVPPKRRRGPAKNLEMKAAYAANGGRPLRLVFDSATFTRVGIINDWFKRQIGMNMLRSIPFDRPDWSSVSDFEKDGLIKSLQVYFDLDEVTQDPQYRLKWEGITSTMQTMYSSRKNKAKEHFLRNGGYEDVERALSHPPPGMSLDFWKKAITHFTSEQHKKISKVNSKNRQKLPYANRGGSSTYTSTAHKEEITRVKAFRKGCTDKNGMFVSQLAEQQYNAIFQEIIQQTQGTTNSSHSGEASSNAAPVDEVAIFEKILGVRRGRVKGIGRKPSVAASSSQCEGQSSHVPPHQSDDTFEAFLNDPMYRARLKEMFQSFTAEKDSGDKNGVNEEDEDDEGLN